MASNFQQYTNGVTPVTGMAEAGANIGRNYQQGLGQMSTGLAEGIKAYQNNQALSQQADVEGHAVAGQLAMYHQMLSSTPEYADLAGTLNEQVDTLQDLPTMSLPKKLAAVNAAKAALGQVGQNMQMKQMIDASRVNNAFADPNSAAKGNNYMVSSILSDTSLDPHKTYSQNLDVLKANIQAARAKNPNIVLDDDASIISKWHDAISNKVNSSALPAEVKTSLLDQMAKAKEYNNLDGYQDDDSTTDYSKESAGYNAVYNQTATDAIKQKLEKENPITSGYDTIDKKVSSALNFNDKVKTNSSIAELDILKLKRQQLINGATAEELKVTGSSWHSLGEHNYSWFGNFFTGGKTGNEAFQKRTEELSKGWTPSTEMVNKYNVVGTIGKGIYTDASLGDVSNSEYLKLTDAQQELLHTEQKRALNGAQTVADEAAGIIENKGDAGLSEALQTLNKAISKKQDEVNEIYKQQTPTSENTNDATAKARSNLIEQKYQNAIKTIAPVQGDQIAIGSKTDVQSLSLDQQKTQVQDYMRQKFGYVPSAFNQQWTQMHPESQFRVIHNEAGSFYWDGKEFKPVPMKSPEEYAKYAGRIVGQQNQDGTMSPVHLGGGLYAQGTITGSEANVEKVQETLSRQGQAMDAAQKLMNMVDHWNGKSLSPSARADMEEAKATLEAAVRNGLFPSGRVAEWEQEILKNIVPNVTGVFTLDSSSRIKLNNIMEESKKIVSRTAALHGLHVQYSSVPQSYQDQYLQGIRNARLQNRVQNQQQYFQQ